MYTVVYAIYPKEGLAPEDFRRHLTEEHSKIGRRLPGAKRYEQFVVRSAEGAEGPEPGAFAVIQFDSKADFEVAAASPAMAEAGEDAPNFARHFATFEVDVNGLI
jgi:uncharacterized protein (TIGR02118 family)